MQIHSLPAGGAFNYRQYKLLLKYFLSMLFARNIAVSLVTAVNKAAQHLTLKLAALIFNQLNHYLLKFNLYLNLHVYIYIYLFIKKKKKIIKDSSPISTVILVSFPLYNLRRYQYHHWVLVGFQVEGINGLKLACVDCVTIRFIQDRALDSFFPLVALLRLYQLVARHIIWSQFKFLYTRFD